MRESHVSTVQAANKALALVIAASDLDRMPVTHFEPSDLQTLAALSESSRVSARQETAQANRMRAASHLFLVAASNALSAALELNKVSMDLDAADRERLLAVLGTQSAAAGRHAMQACSILRGEIEPPSDDGVVVSKLSA
jgi:hypothetical protein